MLRRPMMALRHLRGSLPLPSCSCSSKRLGVGVAMGSGVQPPLAASSPVSTLCASPSCTSARRVSASLLPCAAPPGPPLSSQQQRAQPQPACPTALTGMQPARAKHSGKKRHTAQSAQQKAQQQTTTTPTPHRGTEQARAPPSAAPTPRPHASQPSATRGAIPSASTASSAPTHTNSTSYTAAAAAAPASHSSSATPPTAAAAAPSTPSRPPSGAAVPPAPAPAPAHPADTGTGAPTAASPGPGHSGHTVPAFLRPVSPVSPAATHAAALASAETLASQQEAEAAVSNSFEAAETVVAGGVTKPAGHDIPTGAPAAGAAPSASASSHAVVVVPNFLRPAPTPILTRIKQWKYFRYWHNIGYMISVVGLLVTDILWLRSIIILANIFGIAVHYSFTPPFWTGIYWSIFFICANLVHITLILLDRREVTLSDEEQAMYDAVFSSVFSAQEYRKLLGEATWRDLPPGEYLMRQGTEIDAVHVVSQGRCVAEQEKLVPLSAEEAEMRRKRGDRVRIETRMINGQEMQVSLFERPAQPVASGSSAMSPPLLDPSAPPSIVKSMATSLLQGGLSWMERFRTRPHPPHEPAHAESTKAEAIPPPAPAAQVNTTVATPAPAPLPESHIQLMRPAAQTTTGAQSPPTATAAAATAGAPAAAPVTPSVSAPAPTSTPPDPSTLPDAVILPTAPTSTAAHQEHAAPDAHHLLNVHVDSTDAAPVPDIQTMAATNAAGTTTPSAQLTPAAATVTAPASSAAAAAASPPAPPAPREVLPVASSFSDGIDLLHGDAEPVPSASSSKDKDDDDDSDLMSGWEELMDEASLSQAEKDAQLQAARLQLESSQQPHSITPEDVLRRWREDRESKKQAKLREREARVAARKAQAERKRLMGMSALERQFGQTDKAKKEKPAAAAGGATTAIGVLSTNTVAGTAAQADTSAAGATAAVSVPAASPSSPSSPSSLPAFECHTSSVGVVRPGRLIGEMCMVSTASSSSAIAPVSVSTSEPTRVLTWQRDSLQRLFFRLPSLAVGWYSVVSTDLVNRLQAQQASANVAAYKHFLLGVLSNDVVTPQQKLRLAQYREQHNVPHEVHVKALTELGWTPGDWERGSTAKGWFDWFSQAPPKHA